MLFVAVLIPDRHTCVICFRALSKHEGSELSSSSVERWVSTLSMTSLLNMSSLAVACATTVTNYLDLCEDGNRPTLDPATCAPSSVPAHCGSHLETSQRCVRRRDARARGGRSAPGMVPPRSSTPSVLGSPDVQTWEGMGSGSPYHRW